MLTDKLPVTLVSPINSMLSEPLSITISPLTSELITFVVMFKLPASNVTVSTLLNSTSLVVSTACPIDIIPVVSS